MARRRSALGLEPSADAMAQLKSGSEVGTGSYFPASGRALHDAGTCAAFLFALFGSMDRRKRWRAAHAARAIADISQPDFVDALVHQSTKDEAGSFMSETLPFYWMSARQWLFLALARISDEQP